jgi:hypothetical protein
MAFKEPEYYGGQFKLNNEIYYEAPEPEIEWDENWKFCIRNIAKARLKTILSYEARQPRM